MPRRTQCRWFAWMGLWLWVLGPIAGELPALHRHEKVDLCELPSVVHDAHQHRVEAGSLAISELGHCHVCHVPRAHVVAAGPFLHSAPASIVRLVARKSQVGSVARIALPPRSPPTTLA